MKYVVLSMVIASVLLVRPTFSSATCFGTVLNCLSDEIGWCSYDGSSFWDTLYAASYGPLDSGDSAQVSCTEDTGCYVIADETDSSFWDCTSYDVDGDVGCGEYACIDVDNTGSITWNSADTEYCCDGTGGDACQTDCD